MTNEYVKVKYLSINKYIKQLIVNQLALILKYYCFCFTLPYSAHIIFLVMIILSKSYQR